MLKHEQILEIRSSGFLLQLPHEVLLEILFYLSLYDLVNLSKTCSTLRQIASDDSLWKKHLSPASLHDTRHKDYCTLFREFQNKKNIFYLLITNEKNEEKNAYKIVQSIYEKGFTACHFTYYLRDKLGDVLQFFRNNHGALDHSILAGKYSPNYLHPPKNLVFEVCIPFYQANKIKNGASNIAQAILANTLKLGEIYAGYYYNEYVYESREPIKFENGKFINPDHDALKYCRII